MSEPNLRIAPTTHSSRTDRELDRLTGTAAPQLVSMSLRHLVPLLLDAVESDRLWLQDFADDVVKIDADLHEVLLAYGEMRGRAAA